MTNVLPNDGFIRSKENLGALINVDNNSLRAYKLRREKEINKENEINSMKKELEDLKLLLLQMLEKNK
jgi:hypothetical protein